MKNSTIDDKINDAIRQVDFFIRRIPPKGTDKIEMYGFPLISITDVDKIDDITTAQIYIEVTKEPICYRVEGEDELKAFKNLRDYWNWSTKAHMKREGLSYATKIASLMHFKENVINNYQKTHGDVVRNIVGIVDETLEELDAVRKEESEVDWYQVPLHNLLRIDPDYVYAHSIRVAGLISELFLNPNNYEKIKQHDREGKLTRKEPCKFRMTRQIIIE